MLTFAESGSERRERGSRSAQSQSGSSQMEPSVCPHIPLSDSQGSTTEPLKAFIKPLKAFINEHSATDTTLFSRHNHHTTNRHNLLSTTQSPHNQQTALDMVGIACYRPYRQDNNNYRVNVRLQSAKDPRRRYVPTLTNRRCHAPTPVAVQR